MKIVIDIPQMTYNHVFDNVGISNNDLKNILLGISNSVILPDGHGRLIDADVVYRNAEEVYYSSEEKDVITPEQMYSLRSWLNSAPTIIEADKAESGE